MRRAVDWLSIDKMQEQRRAIRKLFITGIIAGAIWLMGLSPQLVEKVYALGIYPPISAGLRTVSSLVPFSLGDCLYILLVAVAVWQIARFGVRLYRGEITKQHHWLIPIRLGALVLSLYILFKVLWGLNYSRPTITRQLGVENKRYSPQELVKLAEFLIRKVNHLQQERAQRKQPIKRELHYLRTEAVASYQQLASKQPFFRYQHPAVKPVLNSWIITKIGLEGYYNPLSGEANVNTRLPSTDLPFVTAHEIAHQLGVAREDEANLVGYLVTTQSADLHFQYSGYYGILRNVLFEVRLIAPDHYQALYKQINPGTIADYKNATAFWQGYNSEMFGYMSATLDGFLKLNNQNKGIDSYQDIVLWVYNLHRKELGAINAKTLQR